MENVHLLPTRIERLALAIRNDLQRQSENDRGWIDATFDLCIHLAELRGLYTANIEFGDACEAHGFGETVLNKDKRAAAIEMGQHPEALRACLEVTNSRSIREVKKEFHRVLNAENTKRKRGNAQRIADGRSNTQRTAKKRDHALDVYDRLASSGRTFSRDDLAREAGVSYGTAQRAFDRREEEERARPVPPLDPAAAAPATRERMEAWQRAERKRLRAEIEREVRELFEKEFKERTAYILERAAWAERTLARYDGLMPKQDYATILKCLHPDTSPDAELKAEAFRLFTKHKDILVKPELKASGPPLPETLGELLARRRGR